ncbi:MAG: SDR family oxidoreductase [Actinomycetota bacterium]
MADSGTASALVTGGAGGIGHSLGRMLAQRGHAVVLADLDTEHGPTVAARIGGRFVAADVRDEESVAAAVAAAEELGPVRTVFLNAGTSAGRVPIHEVAVDDYRRVFGVNVDGVFLGIRAAVPALRRAGGGAIVATASLAGVAAWPGDPVYVASKHAVVGMVQSSAPDLVEYGIKLSAVCPGFVDTPMVSEEFRTSGFPLLAAEEVATALMDAAENAEPGELRIVQPGIGAVQYQPRRVPAARAADGSKPPVPGG